MMDNFGVGLYTSSWLPLSTLALCQVTLYHPVPLSWRTRSHFQDGFDLTWSVGWNPLPRRFSGADLTWRVGLNPLARRIPSHLQGWFNLAESRVRFQLEWGFDFTWNGGSISLGRRIWYQFEGGFYLTYRNKASSISLRKRIQTHLQYGFDVSWNVGSISLGRRVYLSRSEAEFDLT